MILVAGGRGTRLGHDLPKALVPLGGTPLVVRAAAVAFQLPDLTALVVVAPASAHEVISELISDAADRSARSAPPVHVAVVTGGRERQDSVRLGLAELPREIDTVLVHDAARPQASLEVYERVIAALQGESSTDAVVPTLPVTDTIKQVDERGVVVHTPDRAALRAVQTPQGFRRRALVAAHHAADAGDGHAATDDAALIERWGGRVVVVPGEVRAEKVTTAEDLQRAEHRLAAERECGGG